MDMDPGEGTSDGRVKRRTNNIKVEIKQEPDIKEEPSDGSELGLTTRLSEGLKNIRGDQGDEPMVQSNASRKRLNPSGKGKKREESKKQNKRKIPRNKVAKKRTEQKCRVCGYVTTRKDHLTRHIRSHTGDKPFKCDVCSKSSAQKSDLIRHKKTHSGEKQFECSVCSKSFAQKNNLNRHFRTHADELPHSCLKCGQRFFEDEANQLHEKRCKHRRYECYLCEYKCFAKSQLKRHMQAKHIGDRQFQCEICGKKFIHRDDLNQHLASHRDQFPFECSKCHRGFAMEEDKTAHENICARRQYQCHICNVFKLHTTNLRRHMRAYHTREKPFHCKWCKARFSYKSNANAHMKRRHRLMK